MPSVYRIYLSNGSSQVMALDMSLADAIARYLDATIGSVCVVKIEEATPTILV